MLSTLKRRPRLLKAFVLTSSILCVAYSSILLFLALRQRHLIYRPQPQLSMLPNAADFRLPYEDAWIPIAGSQERLHGWWIPSASPQEQYAVLANEPAQVLSSPRVMLYFCGVGRNMGDYNYLARIAAFRQLGFSVLVFDYRGYGRSDGDFPNEAQLYEDGEAAWRYLRDSRQIPADQILIYGESLGGAIALDLAIRHPEASGLIMQSSFTSMAEAVRQKPFSSMIPVNLILTEQFDSRSKIGSLQVPVLFIHGEQDSVVPFEMSQALYTTAPEPKHLFLIARADHVRIYQPGQESYLKAIGDFANSLP